MRTLLYIGTVAVGVLFFVYHRYLQSQQNEMYHSHDGQGGANYDDEEEYEVEVVNEDAPTQGGDSRSVRNMIGFDDICAICQDHLLQRNALTKYCVIALPGCGHWLHQKCALRLLEYHPMCPVCRIPIDRTMLRNTPVRIARPENETDAQDDEL